VIVGQFVKVVEKRKRAKEEAHTIALVVIAIEARADFAFMDYLGNPFLKQGYRTRKQPDALKMIYLPLSVTLAYLGIIRRPSVPPLSRLRTLQASSRARDRSEIASLVQEALSDQPVIRFPFLFDQSLLKMPF
jgi:hypothetical protein